MKTRTLLSTIALAGMLLAACDSGKWFTTSTEQRDHELRMEQEKTKQKQFELEAKRIDNRAKQFPRMAELCEKMMAINKNTNCNLNP